MGKNSNKHRSLNRVWCTWDKKKPWNGSLFVTLLLLFIEFPPFIFHFFGSWNAVVQETSPNLAKWNRFECNLAHIQLLYQPTITQFESPLHANNFMYLCEKCVTNFAICIPLLINNNNVSCNWFTFVRVCNWKQVKKTQTTYKIFIWYKSLWYRTKTEIIVHRTTFNLRKKCAYVYTIRCPKQNNFNLQWKNQLFEQNKRKQHESRGNVFHTEKTRKKNEMSRKPIFYLENEYAMQLQLIENGDSGEKK